MPSYSDDQPHDSRATDFVRRARLYAAASTTASVAEGRPRQHAARRPRSNSRIMLGGCAIALSVIGFLSSMRALELSHPPACEALPIRLTFGAATAANIETGKGAACTVTLQADTTPVDGLTVTSAARHGSIAPRSQSSVIYQPHDDYRGEDSFALAVRERTTADGRIAIVRVRVTVR